MELVEDRTESALVDRQQRGAAIQARYERLGLSDREWYRRTGIDRKTLLRAINAEQRVRESTYAAVEAALDKLEAYVRGEATAQPEPHMISFSVKNAQGLDIVVSGPVEDADELRAQVEALARALGN